MGPNVQVYRNLSPAELVEHALRRGEGTLADLDSSDVKPTWVFDDIGALHRAWEGVGAP